LPGLVFGLFKRFALVRVGPSCAQLSTHAEVSSGPLSESNRSIGCPRVVKGDDHNSILGLDVHVDDDQPPPWANQCPTISPKARQLLPSPRKLLQGEQRARDAFPRIGGKPAGLDQAAKLITRLARDLNSWHRLKLGERHRLTAPSLLDRLLCPLPGPRNPVENFGDPQGIGIGFIQCAGKKRASQGPFLDMRALRQARQLPRVVRLESDVDSTVPLSHSSRVHARAHGVQTPGNHGSLNPMAHHKRKRPKYRRSGCLLCKPHKLTAHQKSARRRADNSWRRYEKAATTATADPSHGPCCGDGP